MSEIPESTFLFHVYQGKKSLKELHVNEKDIITSQDLPDFKNKTLSIILKQDGEKIVAFFSKAVLINGVEYHSRALKPGYTLKLGPYRLVYTGKKHAENPAPVISAARKEKTKKTYKRNYTPTSRKSMQKQYPIRKHRQATAVLITEAAAVLSSLFFLWFCSTQRLIQKEPAIFPSTVKIQNHETPPPLKKENEKPKIVPKQPLKEPSGFLITYSPDATIVPAKLDILFIHAHPDDETLDYGLSIARAAEKGMKVGVLTFTDGESGFDFYPDRDTTGMYPDKELSGKKLAAVRIEEEENSLKVLGAYMYLRLGLKNRPYTKEEVNKPLPTLIKEWGGRDFLIKKLSGIFSVLSPDIIVSPDGPSKAREHFEHEAVGYISNLAVTDYQNKHPGRIKAYLKLVDVQQTQAYPDKILMTIKVVNEGSDIIAKKYKALSQYQTQADASYYGIKRLKKFPVEYYFFQYQINANIADFLFGSKNKKIASNNL